jgi:hypothetical protein
LLEYEHYKLPAGEIMRTDRPRIGPLNRSLPFRTLALTVVSLVLLALPLVPGNRNAAHAQEFGAGPMSLVMTYQCPAAQRAAFRKHMDGPGVARFEAWKRQGVFSDYLILFSSYVNLGATAPDMVIRLDFARYADSGKWKAIERDNPAGLTTQALALCTPVTSYLADLLYAGQPAPGRDVSKSVYLWIPYHLEKEVSKAQYKKYFEVYVKPQNDAWLAEGALSWWGVYFNQHNTGVPWDMLFLYEYTGLEGLARRDNVKWAVREKLRENPAWKAASDNKQRIRIEDQVIILDPIMPRRP